jgi:hypothetical protein
MADRSDLSVRNGTARKDVLQITLFGGFAVSLGGRDIPIANRKGKALLGCKTLPALRDMFKAAGFKGFDTLFPRVHFDFRSIAT